MSQHHEHTIVESVGHEGRGTTVVEMYELVNGDDEATFNLALFIAKLQEEMEKIPEAFRAGAELRLKAYGDCANVYAGVIYTRPETDEELSSRQGWLQGLTNEREKRDRMEFERLKKKYGQ